MSTPREQGQLPPGVYLASAPTRRADDEAAEGPVGLADLEAEDRDRINAEIDEIDARMASDLQQTATSRILNAPDPGAAFRGAPLDIQRAVIRSVMTITVLPAPKRGGSWTEERLQVERIA